MEIERKFLVVDDGWRHHVGRVLHLRDGLVAALDGRKVRVRICGESATLTVKSERIGISRLEFEYEIPLQEAEHLITLCGTHVLEKMRFYVPYRGAIWQVDRYTNPFQLVMAEIELTREGEPVDLPPWLGEEVTGNPAYRKANLLKSFLDGVAR